MCEKVTWKSVQDRYQRLYNMVCKCDQRNQRLSGVSGEIGKLDELLSTRKEARDNVEKMKDDKRATVAYL